jgi:hypothetical protein
MTLTAAQSFATYVALAIAAALGGGGCIDSVDSDGVVDGLDGGQTLDAATGLSPQNPPPPAAVCTGDGKPGDPCSVASTCCGVDQGAEICDFNGSAAGVCQAEPPLQGANTWSALYADYFGGKGRAACAGNGSCHGSTDGAGYLGSGGFLCPPDDATGCYKSLTSPPLALITPDQPLKGDYLYQVLRKAEVGGADPGTMPAEPVQVYAFSPNDLDRLAAWIAAGYPND